MLFELRNFIPEVSPAWVEARDAFLQGKSHQAWDLAQSLRGKSALKTPNDYLLNIEIARASLAHRTYLALVHRGLAAFPENPLLRLYFARAALTRGRILQGIEAMLAWEPTLGQTHRALWGTELANLYACARFQASSERWLEEVREEQGINSPLALYTQSCAREGVQQWDEAIEYAQQAVAAAPDWSRLRAYLTTCLLSRGKVEEAQAQLAEAARRGHEEAMIDFLDAMLAMSLGDFPAASEKLLAILENWPQCVYLDYVRRSACVVLVEQGRHAQARELIAGREEQLGLPAIGEKGAGQHCFLPLPLVAQDKNECVPTAVAMALFPQGRRYDPNRMYREMRGREGTPMWRMRQWIQQQGCAVIPVRLERSCITALLEAGIPLVGMLEGPFNNHVDVLCGYNDDLDTLFVRDPAHWAPLAVPWEPALQRYALHDAVLAIVDPANAQAHELAQQYRRDECDALIDLGQAFSQADRPLAETAYARIADDSPAAFHRDCFGVNTAISPQRRQDRMRAVLDDDQANLMARFRAATTLSDHTTEDLLEELLQKEDSHRLGIGLRRYLRVMQLMNAGQWREALASCDQLLRSGCGIARFWELRSDALAELGEQEASREALERAIELEPERMSLREKSLRRSASQINFIKYLEEFETLLAEDPEDKSLLWARAGALLDGPDGLAHEQAARDVLRWYPRAPESYTSLASWYEMQERPDLVEALLAEARELLPEIFAPPEEPPVASPTEPVLLDPEEEAQGVFLAEKGLPEDKVALLDLAWQPETPLQAAAIDKLLEHEQAGQLNWYESARLLAARLLSSDDAQLTAEAASLFPAHPPGAPTWFASVVCGSVTEHRPSARLAAALGDWLERLVGDITRYPNLWFDRVLLYEHAGQMEQALEQLSALLERYPATSSALYRMGMVKHGQRDYPAARGYFEQALEVNPGLYGAMEMLRAVCEILGDHEAMLAAIGMLRRKAPHDLRHLREELRTVATIDAPARAMALLEEAAPNFPPRRITCLRAQLLLDAGKVSEAQETLATITLTEEDNELEYEEWLKMHLDLVLVQNDHPRVVGLCRKGLARWPDSARLKELLARHLPPSEQEEGRRLLLEVLHSPYATEQTAFLYLQQSTIQPHVAAQQAVWELPEDEQPPLADLFLTVLNEPEFINSYEPFLEWSLEKYPAYDRITWAAATYFDYIGQQERGLALAEQFLARNPENGDALHTLGRCLIQNDPRRGLEYLERACQLNRTTPFLFDLARCHKAIGNRDRAIELHWQILEQDPYQSASWSNLWMEKQSLQRLWPFVEPILQHGWSEQDEYFLVAVVQAAIHLKKRVPRSWYRVAVMRWMLLEQYPPFQDERDRLRRALSAWLAVRPHDGKNSGLPFPPTFLEKFITHLTWPGRHWIPTR